MSSASMPRRCSSSRRISFVHGSAPSTATLRLVERGSMPAVGHRVGDREQVARRAQDRVGLEVADELHLARGLPARHRDDGRAELLDAAVRAEAAGEEAVAVGVVHLHARADAAAAERSGDQRRPAVEVALRVADDGRPAGRARRGVDARDLLHRHGEHAERVGLAQVLLRREGQLRDIVERADVVGVHARLVELASCRAARCS